MSKRLTRLRITTGNFRFSQGFLATIFYRLRDFFNLHTFNRDSLRGYLKTHHCDQDSVQEACKGARRRRESE